MIKRRDFVGTGSTKAERCGKGTSECGYRRDGLLRGNKLADKYVNISPNHQLLIPHFS